MELILISIILLFTFAFVGLVSLGYAITIWEQKVLEEKAKNINSKNSGSSQTTAINSSKSETNFSKDMKPTQKVGHYLERSLVLVKNQDYQGWMNKTVTVVKKVSSNVELYSKFFWSKVVELVTKNKVDENPLKQSDNKDVDTTIDKINKINQKEQSKNTNNDTLNQLNNNTKIAMDNEAESYQNPQNNLHSNYEAQTFSNSKTERSNINNSFATLNFASEIENQALPKKIDSGKKLKDEVYEKIEANILHRLKETGLSHYDIWLELGKHYEKYGEREKAIEIYSMVMKHSTGKDKDTARDGLISLS